MSQFYDDNNELSIYYPVNTPIIYKLEEDFENIQVISPLIENQITNLTDLCHQYKFNIYSPYINIFLSNQLDYINKNYFYLNNFDTILDNDIQLRLVFMYLYDLIANDLIIKIIPNILSNNKLDVKTLLLIDTDTLKEYIYKSLQHFIKLFNKIKNNISKINNISEMEYNSLRYTFYLDLFDSDLSMFQENLLNTILIKYDTLIDAFISK